ncbi:MAG: dihydroorotate dehydrogenase electron transfer subunit [Candidatus Omnitrophica bacterium]|nr:dihydroorotate dehydrogenase electron transfer subunit [Candidatus Omnitrophota bacterium]
MGKTIYQEKTRILSKQKLASNFFLLKIASKKIAANSAPGQFVQIRVQDSVVPLLRRPLGVHRIEKNNFEVLFQVVGKATEMLAQKNSGDYLDVIGPLGNGFNLQKRGEIILVAGGMGVAPLVFLAEKLKKSVDPKSKIQKIALIGAKTKTQILCETEFKKSGFEVRVSTDDGSKGAKGYVSDLLKQVLRTTHFALRPNIFACGPRPMLKEIAKLSKEFGIPAQVSLEEHMACGIGACLGCAVETSKGFKRVCKDGPVFQAEEVIW